METFWIKTEKKRNRLQEKLLSAGIPNEVVNNIVLSGYFMMSQDDTIWDGHYGNLYPLSIAGIKEIVSGKTKTFRPKDTQTLDVKSIADANAKIKNYISKFNPNLSNRWAFRGENCVWNLAREFPNPWMCDSNGNEISLLLSYWRNEKFGKNCLYRFSDNFSIFSTMYADDIEDKFYAKLLEMKDKYPEIWGEITEYH